MSDKKTLRREAAEKIAAMSVSARALAERRLIIAAEIFLRQHFHADDWIMAYCPLADEPAIMPLLEIILEHPFRLCLPVIGAEGKMAARQVTDLTHNLTVNKWQILEPGAECPTVEPARIAAVLVPGRAFTAAGDRLGRGRGYYDRFLPRTPAKRIALAFRGQMFAALPTDTHDQKMHTILVG